jgi:ribose-phosphate pyrophosphokinase
MLPNPRPMEKQIARKLDGTSRQLAEWRSFASGEWHVRVKEVTPHAYVIGRFEPPADNFIRTLLLMDTLRRNGAEHIDLILPHYAYTRQDRMREEGDCVSSLFSVRAAASAGAERIVTAEMHTARSFDIAPIQILNVSLIPSFAQEYKRFIGKEPVTVVAPDRNSVSRSGLFARILGAGTGTMWVEKNRDTKGNVIGRNIFGRPVGKTAVIVDDLVDTGVTAFEAAKLLRKEGIRRLHLVSVHAIFSKGAMGLVAKSRFDRIFVSDTLPMPKGMAKLTKLTVVECADLLVKAARREV